jgi:hypothetical protein
METTNTDINQSQQVKNLSRFNFPIGLNIPEDVGIALEQYIESVVKEVIASKADDILIKFCSIRERDFTHQILFKDLGAVFTETPNDHERPLPTLLG